MSRNPKLREFLRRLVELGCTPLRSRGSHERWVTPGGQTLTVVLSKSGADVTREVRTSVERVLRREDLSLYESDNRPTNC